MVGMEEHADRLKRALELHKRSRESFSEAHQNGIAALARHDYRALHSAVREEASAIAAHAAAFKQLTETIRSRGK